MKKKKVITLAVEDSPSSIQHLNIIKTKLESRNYTLELQKIEAPNPSNSKNLAEYVQKQKQSIESLHDLILNSEVDGAAYNMIHAPLTLPGELILSGAIRQDVVRDILLTTDGGSLTNLSSNKIVGISNHRNSLQLKSVREDLEQEFSFENIYSKFQDWFSNNPSSKALILSSEEFNTYDFSKNTKGFFLPPRTFVPAPCQGTFSIISIDDTKSTTNIHNLIDNPRARVETIIEKIISSSLNQNIIQSAGIHAIVKGEAITVMIQLFNYPSQKHINLHQDLPIRTYFESAKELAKKLNKMVSDFD